MGFFTAGNLITLGIVGLLLVLFRYFDQNNRRLRKVSEYAESLKEQLGAYVAEREEGVRDFTTNLKIEVESAKELMRRIQGIDQDVGEKFRVVAEIGERLNLYDERFTAYDNSMEELVEMTERVQENLNRIRDESQYVEDVTKRLGELRTKADELDRDLGAMEFRFERENTEALEKTVESITAEVRSTVSDLMTTAETIERRVEDYREEISKIELDRSAGVDRDLRLIERTFEEVFEKAGERAEKMEDAVLVKLKIRAMGAEFIHTDRRM